MSTYFTDRLRAPPTNYLNEKTRAYDYEDRANAIAEHLLLTPAVRHVHLMALPVELLSVARTLTDNQGQKVMPEIEDVEFTKQVLKKICSYISHTRDHADNFTLHGKKFIHRVAGVVVAMAQADDEHLINDPPLAKIACQVCLGGLNYKGDNCDKHVLDDGCLYKRDITIIDKYVERAFYWIVSEDPQFYLSEAEFDYDDWPVIQRALHLDWIRYVRPLRKMVPLICPTCQTPWGLLEPAI